MLRRLHSERGVAALTVVLVSSVLAVSGAVVVFSATAELQMGGRERRAEDAFSAAEAGLDIAAAHLFAEPTFAEGQLETCLDNPLVSASAGVACEIRITSPSHGGRFFYPTSGLPFIDYTVVSRAKEGRSVVRTLAGTYRLQAIDIPYGTFIDGNVDLNGNAKLLQESMLVTGNVFSREKASTDANGNRAFDDPDLGWAFHRDRISSNPSPTMCTDASGRIVGCAGVFANFQIFETRGGGTEIHGAGPDPTLSGFPIDRDRHQANVVNGVTQPVVTLPTTEILTPMESLRKLAEQQGLYFDYRDGAGRQIQIQPGDLGAATREFRRNVVVYIDADADDEIGWKVNLIPGDTGSDIRYTNDAGQQVGSLSGVIVVRGGSLRLESNTLWSGALFVPENTLRILGGAVCTCTIYAKGFEAEGGNSTIQLTADWFTRLPSGFVEVRRTAFLECERYQPSAVCPTT